MAARLKLNQEDPRFTISGFSLTTRLTIRNGKMIRTTTFNHLNEVRANWNTGFRIHPS